MSIIFDKKLNAFYLDGKNTTYAFYINEVGYAEHLYYGKKLAHDDLRYSYTFGSHSQLSTVPGRDDLPFSRMSYLQFAPELSFFGTSDYREPCVLAENAGGDRLSDLLYDGYDIVSEKPSIPGMPSMSGGETLIIHLKDKLTLFSADLYYTVYDDADVIARHIVYRNGGNTDVKLHRAYSFSFALPDGSYDVMSLYGAWGRERSIERTPLHHGVFSVDSKRCSSSALLNPFIALLDKNTCEDYGNAYGFSLVYSSSFVLKAEGNPDGSCVVSGGINDFDFGWKLCAGESLATPEIVIAYSNDGIGGMSRTFHDAFRNHLINSARVFKPRPLLINNWEGTYFNFNYEKLAAIIDAVAGTGIDTFVLDDGWFGKRDDDLSGLGDWVVNEKKLVGGLKRVIDHAHEKGMKFGLWFEPEMVNEDSDLYRAHPDYAIGAPNRPHCYSRHQLMLDLTREDVRDYIVNAVNKVIHENGIEYVKWDFNRYATEFYSAKLDADRQSEFSHRYALGLYDLCERIVKANPNVFFEGCASGGSRFDPAMLYYFAQIWTSDDTDAEERTHIQYGTSIVYPLSSMSCHVSICPNHQTSRITPFSTRAAIAHLGATGYELDTTTFTEDDKKLVAAQTKEYRENQALILEGDLYRIENPMETNFFSESVVSKDKSSAMLTCYRRMGRTNNPMHHVLMKGLDCNKNYFVRELGITLSGSVLMNIGLAPRFNDGDFEAVVYHFEAIK